MILRLPEDVRAGGRRAGVARVDVVDAHQHRARSRTVAPLDRDDGAVAEPELRPVSADPEAHA